MAGQMVAQVDIATLTADAFSSKTGQEFQFQFEDLVLPVTLMDCKENPDGAGPDCKRTPFNLMFQADEDTDHPLIQVRDFAADIIGLEEGTINNLWIIRTLRPVSMPAGAYFQVVFS